MKNHNKPACSVALTVLASVGGITLAHIYFGGIAISVCRTVKQGRDESIVSCFTLVIDRRRLPPLTKLLRYTCTSFLPNQVGRYKLLPPRLDHIFLVLQVRCGEKEKHQNPSSQGRKTNVT